MKIVIKSAQFDIRRGISKAGKPYELRVQTALLHRDDEVQKFNVILGRDQTPYAPGNYVLGDDSFRVNDFGDLVIGRLNLSPVGAGVSKVA